MVYLIIFIYHTRLIMNLDTNSIIMAVLGIITFLNFILLALYNSQVEKFKKMYQKALEKFNSRENVNDEFQTIYDRLNEIEELTNNAVDNVNIFAEKMKNNVQKVGFVKYNAYDDTDNKLSFSLALLDEKEDGILINHVYSKHGSNFYAKLVRSSKVEERITEEEAMAIKLAVEDKEFKERNIKELKKIKRNKKQNKKLIFK